MILLLEPAQAQSWFDSLPPEWRIATLSPRYVLADACRDPGLEPVFLGYREEDGFWLHGLHRSWAQRAGVWDLQSPYGYGGPVSSTDSAAFCARAWQAYGQWCAQAGILAEFVRFHPLASGRQCYGGQRRPDRQTVVLDVSPNRIRDQYEIRCRTAVRKAEREGLQVTIHPASEIASRFVTFYRASMQAMNAAPMYLFSDAYFESLGQWGDAMLLVCKRGEQWLSAGLFLKGGQALEYHLSATTTEGRKLAATNLLLDHAAQLAHGMGLHWLYLGGGTTALADNPLLRFKAGFSGLRLPFEIGFTIHQPEVYLDLQRRLSCEASAKVLFYREE